MSEPRRKTYLKRSSKPIKRSAVKLRPRKKDPSKRRFAKRRCQPYLDWLKQQACAITGKLTGQFAWRLPEAVGPTTCYEGREVLVDPAHCKPRSTGGDDLYNAFPLSRHLHDEQHDIGWIEFEKKYRINRWALAKAYTERFLATQEETQ